MKKSDSAKCSRWVGQMKECEGETRCEMKV